MRFTWAKKFSTYLMVLSGIGLIAGAYAEYEHLHTAKEVLRFVAPEQSTYRLKSSYWLFDRYKKIVLSDDEVGMGKVPSPEVYDVLAFKPRKFLLLYLCSSVVIWAISLSSAWFLKGVKGNTALVFNPPQVHERILQIQAALKQLTDTYKGDQHVHLQILGHVAEMNLALSERAEIASRRLEWLSIWLIVVTVALIVLTFALLVLPK